MRRMIVTILLCLAFTGTVYAGEWTQNEGKWYYLEDDGAMLRNTLTPDGYFVGADGAWCSEAWPGVSKGPGVLLNQYRSGMTTGSSKVKFQTTAFPSLSESQRALAFSMAESYEQREGSQQFFHPYTAKELGEYLGIPITEDACVLPKDLVAGINAINAAFYKETGAFLILDYTYYFYGDAENPRLSEINVIYSTRTVAAILNANEQIQLINMLMAELGIVDGETTQVDAVWKFSNFIEKNWIYDKEFIRANTLTSLMTRRGVCYQFSMVYKALCDFCGIVCDVVGGANSEEPEEAGHCWNRNVIDGHVSYTDTTWKDTMMTRHTLASTHFTYDMKY